MAWIIVLSIIALLVFLLFLPIRVFVKYDDDIQVSLRVLFFFHSLYPKKKKIKLSDYSKKAMRKRRRKAKKKKQIALEKERLKQKKAKKKPQKTLKQKLRTVRLLLYIFKNAYRKIIKAIHIHIYELRVIVATDDAAKTGILYGVACQGVNHITALLQNTTKTTVKKDALAVYADFCKTESRLYLNLCFSTNAARIIALGIRAVFLFFLFKGKEPQNTNKTNGVNEK